MEISRPSWDEYFMAIAHKVKDRSTCLSRQTGSLLIKDKRIISTGYNGTPTGLLHCNEGGCPRCGERIKGLIESGKDLDKCTCCHAEENTIVQAALHGISTKDTILYTTNAPCTQCAKMVINAGIKKVVTDESYPDTLGLELLKNAKIEVFTIKLKTF